MSQFPAHYSIPGTLLGRCPLVIEPWQWKITNLYQLTTVVLQRQGFLIASAPHEVSAWPILHFATAGWLDHVGSFNTQQPQQPQRPHPQQLLSNHSDQLCPANFCWASDWALFVAQPHSLCTTPQRKGLSSRLILEGKLLGTPKSTSSISIYVFLLWHMFIISQ